MRSKTKFDFRLDEEALIKIYRRKEGSKREGAVG